MDTTQMKCIMNKEQGLQKF